MANSITGMLDMATALQADQIDYISNLPPELKQLVSDLMGVEDVISIGIASSSWEEFAAAALRRDPGGFVFSLRPHTRNNADMTTLQEICRRPIIAMAIRRLKIFVGDFHVPEFATAVRGNFRFDEKCRSDLDLVLGGLKQNQKRHCDCEDLSWVFSRLPHLEDVVATSTEFPFSNVESNFWSGWQIAMGGWQSMPPVPGLQSPVRTAIIPMFDASQAYRRYRNIVLAAGSLRKEAKLTMDSVPLAYFLDFHLKTTYMEKSRETRTCTRDDYSFLSEASACMCHLQHLKIRFVGLSRYTGHANWYQEHSDSFPAEAVSKLTASMKGLQMLDLDWDIDNVPKDIIMRSTIFQNLWPQLGSLKLQDVVVADRLLSRFLLWHKPSLRRFHLSKSTIIFRRGDSYRTFLTKLRDHLELEKLELLIHGDEEPFYDENWNILDDGSSHSPQARILDSFVTGKIDRWPMETDGPDHRNQNRWRLLPEFDQA
jgi:hypothetical protein